MFWTTLSLGSLREGALGLGVGEDKGFFINSLRIIPREMLEMWKSKSGHYYTTWACYLVTMKYRAYGILGCLWANLMCNMVSKVYGPF